jgi:hypothetical protein
MQRRRARWRPLARPIESRWLRRYRSLVTNAARGAVLADPDDDAREAANEGRAESETLQGRSTW